MSCAEFLARLQALLDQDSAPELDGILTDHASHCATCRERLTAQAQLFSVLSEVACEWCDRDEALPTSSVLEPNRAELRNGTKRPNWLRLVICSAASSAALLALSIWYLPQAPSSDATAVAISRSPVPSPAVMALTNMPRAAAYRPDAIRPQQTPPSDRSSAKREFDQKDLAERSADSVDPYSFTGRLSLMDLGIAVETQHISVFYDTLCKSPPIPDPLVPQVDQLADELLPIAQPFVSVLNVLRRTLPGTRSPALPPHQGEATHAVRWQSWA